MDVRIHIEEVGKLQERLQKDADLYRRGLRLQMARALTLLKAAIQQNIRRRSGLNVRSGSLLNSIVSEVVEKDGSITGEIGPTGIPYAKVHEFGHNFKARFVKPRNAKVLSWIGSDGMRWYSKGHWIGAFRVPARPYLRPAMDQLRDTIAERFGLFMQESFGGK